MTADAAIRPSWVKPASAEMEARRLLAQDRPSEAVALALSAGMLDLAAELLAGGSVTLARNSGDYDVFFSIVQRLGPERVRRWPELDAAAIWALTMSNRLRLATTRLDELEARIPLLIAEGRTFVVENLRTPFDRSDPNTAMQCWVAMMRAMIASFTGDSGRTLEIAHDWWRDFPRAAEYDAATVRCATALAHFTEGRIPESERDFLAALAAFRDAHAENGIAWSVTGAVCAQVAQGCVEQASQLLEESSARVARGLPRPTYVDVPLRAARALVLFERGEFAAAMAEVQRQTELTSDAAAPVLAFSNLRVTARCLLALGRPAQALAVFERPRVVGSPAAQPWWDQQWALERARTAALAGESDKRYFAGPAAEQPLLKLLAVSLRGATPAHLRPLRELLQQVESGNSGEALALALFIKARIERDLGQALQSRRSLNRLLTSPLIRERVGTLAALAPGLQPMFNEALQAVLRDPACATDSLHTLARIVGLRPRNEAIARPEPAISKRERQIAPLLLDGLSNREIAERLHLAEQTVKWHLWNLFQKLGVSNRMGAIRSLSRLGISDSA